MNTVNEKAEGGETEEPEANGEERHINSPNDREESCMAGLVVATTLF